MSGSNKSKGFRDTKIGDFFYKTIEKIKTAFCGKDGQDTKISAALKKMGEFCVNVKDNVVKFTKNAAQKISIQFKKIKNAVVSSAFFSTVKQKISSVFSKNNENSGTAAASETNLTEENVEKRFKCDTNTNENKKNSVTFKAVCISVFAAIALFFKKLYNAVKNKLANRPKKEKPQETSEKGLEKVENSLSAAESTALLEPSKFQVRPRIRFDDKKKNDDDDDDYEKKGMWIRDRRPFFMVSIGVAVCRLCLLLVVVAGFAGLGIGLGVVRAYIASAPELSIEKIENNDQTSFIYDANGDLLMEYYNLENRSWASYDEIPTMLKYAVVASEDESFFEHSGFNFKRIVASALSNLGGGSVSGGSTITQQVLKLTLLTSQQTYKRKIQEIYLAYQLEKEYNKDDILEWYMNIMPMGGLLYGVKAAAEDYFGKDLSELNLRECAVLAGATNAPTYYDPRLCMLSEENNGYGEKGRLRLYTRANYVLTQMYAVGFITEEEYNEALFDTEDMETDQIVVVPTSSNYTYEHKYYIEYVLDELVNRLMEANGWEGTIGTQQAYSLLRSGGLKIYTAFNEKTQSAVENAVYSYTAWPELADPSTSVSSGGIEQPQCATVVIDNATGYLAAIVGGRTEPTIRMGLNRAYQSILACGSAIKPIGVYGPALDKGLLGNMVIENVPLAIDGWQSATGFPRNLDGALSYLGPTSISFALVKSLNLPTARLLLGRLGTQLSYNYLRSMGFSEKTLSLNPSDLALGSTGSYLIEFAAAFATLANSGVYRAPISITKIIDKDDEEIFSNENQTYKKIFKDSTAYIITQWLHRAASRPESPVHLELSVNPDIEIAGKTGTNENSRGIAYMGYTRYYTCGVWIGHDDFTPGFKDGVTALYYATPFWLSIMNNLHAGLDAAKIYDTAPDDVIEVTICAVSGMLPNGDVCDHDQSSWTSAYGQTTYGTRTEYFIRGTEPTEVCNMHKEVEFCSLTGKLANEYCTDDTIVRKTVVVLDADSEYLRLIGTDYEYLLYNYFPIYFVDGVPYMDGLSGNECYCSVHNSASSDLFELKAEMLAKSDALIDSINRNLRLDKYSSNMSPLELQHINNAISILLEKVNAPIYGGESIETFDIEEAREAYDALESISQTIFETIDLKLQTKSDYTTLSNRLIGQINIKLLRSDYASVIIMEELISINEDIDALRNALNAPIYTDDEETELFDVELVLALYDTLQLNSDNLFAALDRRLEIPDEPDPPVDDVFGVFTDDSTLTLTDEIRSMFALIIDANTGRIIAQKNSDAKMYPASMTKIMTVIVAYEYMRDNGVDIDSTYIMLTDEILALVEEKNAAGAGFVSGELVVMRDLLYAALVQSGADATLMLAEYCAGSEEAFVAMMNSKAAEMKLTGTHFTNCIGLHDEDHYSTANDMAVILAYANEIPLLKNAMETNTYTYKQTNMQDERTVESSLYRWRNSYSESLDDSAVRGASEFGGKTGYTQEAGNCIITFAYDSNGNKYIVVTAGADAGNDAIMDYLYLYGEFADFGV